VNIGESKENTKHRMVSTNNPTYHPNESCQKERGDNHMKPIRKSMPPYYFAGAVHARKKKNQQ
jgi:hypothetical protein